MGHRDAVIQVLPTVEPRAPSLRKTPSVHVAEVSANSFETDKPMMARPRGLRHTSTESSAKRGFDVDGNPLTKLGQLRVDLTQYNVFLRFFLYAAPFGLLLAIPIIVGKCTPAGRGAYIGGVKMYWFFGWLEILWLSFWIIKLAVRGTSTVFRFITGIISAGLRKYSDVCHALETPLSLVVWFLVSYLTLFHILPQEIHHTTVNGKDVESRTPGWEYWVHRVMGALLVCSIVLLVEKTLIQYISIDYHRKQFEGKIRTSKRNIELLGKLYKTSRDMFPEYCDGFYDLDVKISRDEVKTDSALGLLQTVGRVGGKVTSVFATNAFGNIAREITGKQVLDPTSPHSIVTKALEDERSSLALAHRLWKSFTVEDQEAFTRMELIETVGVDSKDVVDETFDIIDRDENGDISFEELQYAITQWGNDRKSINTSIHDVDHAISALDGLLMICVFVLDIIIIVGFLNNSFSSGVQKYYTAIMSASWVVAASIQEILGSCIFIFVKHPFDNLDRVDINGEELIVEQINLLFTVFRRVSDRKITQTPNIVLNSSTVQNVSRSPPMREQIKLNVAYDTSRADIDLLRASMEAFVTSKENSRDFQSSVDIEYVVSGDLGKLELVVDFGYKSNLAIESLRQSRRNRFYLALVEVLRKIPIYGPGGGGCGLGDAAKPTYTVAISHEESLANQERFKREKEAKRMVPSIPAAVPLPVVVEDTGISTGVSVQR